MHQAKLISIAAVLVVGLAGCGSEPTPSDADSDLLGTTPLSADDLNEEADGAAGDAETGVATASTPATDGTADDASGEPKPVGAVPLDLITSTNPNTRAQQVQRDRPDPFSLLPANPTVEVRETAGSGSAATQTAALPQGNGGAAGSGASSPNADGSGSATDGSAAADAGPPPPPPTTLARAVAVSGVVRIGSVPYAIVQAPNEASRYVRAGESLSNGAVLVKRIDASSFEPVVVLEQNGVEVVRNVEGGRPAGDEDEVAEAADEAAVSS